MFSFKSDANDERPGGSFSDEELQGLLRMDNEAQPILDQGHSSLAQVEDAMGQYRNVYIGMHVASHKHKHHKHHKHKDHRRPTRKSSSKSFESEEEPTILPPNQQVQFILGTAPNGTDMQCLKPANGMPHVFTEMEQLKEEEGYLFWRETARWIKFEESVEEGGDRWSKPHVATLSLHSLFELRSCIMNGVVQLDMVAQDLVQIADLILDQMISQGQLPHDDDLRDNIRAALLSGHEHQGERKKGVRSIRSVADFADTRKDTVLSLKPQGLHTVTTAPTSIARSKSVTNASFNAYQLDQNGVNEHDKKNKVPYFMKKIPTGSEANNVLIGEVDYLEQRIVAFIRLEESLHLARMTEVPVPTRFLFILLGPVGNYSQYREIGRSIATLMADEVFREVAYKAKTRKDLLSGIDEFLDQVTVLPPGEWDSSIRIEPPKELPANQKKRLEPHQNFVSQSNSVEKEEQEEHVTVGPELQRTGRLFGGLIADIKRKAPNYASDFKDCLSIQCLASFIFLYFAILTPIVTFGGLLGDATHNYIGTMESIFGGAMSGIIYHLFAGQPLTIIGSTGPILVFEKIMFEICTTIGLEYISFRFWVGIWTGLICIILVATDASSLISYVTRYTEESFSALISLIFIVEAFKKLVHEGDKLKIWYGWEPDNITYYGCECISPNLSHYNITNKTTEEHIHITREEAASSHEGGHPGKLFRTGNLSYSCVFANTVTNVSDVNDISWSQLSKHECLSTYCGTLSGESCIYTPDAVFMSIILFFGTFTIATMLKGLKTTRYFPTKIRSIISDFAVTIGIAVMVLFDIIMDIRTPKLVVPQTFRPTRDDRGWLIDPFYGNPWWSALLALAPAILATILIFMDQQITAVIVNRKENKLRKGAGYHLDLLIVSIMLMICSVMGLPWFVAATVLSITHVNSLRMESETTAPGEAAKFLGVREQRVTGIMIFLMIGVSVFLTPVLAYIPMPVLYGVFLYMGVSSLKGVQFIDRVKLYFMPPKHQPDFIYLRHVPLRKVYLFTAFQVLGLAILWIIKSSPPVSIIFPMMVVALVGVRKLFDFGIFTQQELKRLDDIMPESTKKKKEDARKKKEKEAVKSESGEQLPLRGRGTVNVSLESGKVLRIPVSELKHNCTSSSSLNYHWCPSDPSSVNISKEMGQTAIWKTLDSNEIRNNSYSEFRHRKVKSDTSKVRASYSLGNNANYDASTKSSDPTVTISISDDESKI